MRRLIIILIAASAIAAPHRYAGRPLLDALRDLEAQGLHLIFSEELVSPSLMVKDEPRASQPRQILDELLEPHALRAVEGPRGALLIVRSKETRRAKMPVALAEIVVTPSRFEILKSEPDGRQFLSREEVRSVPHPGDDLYRAIAHVPGTTSNDLTARPNIRGGAEDEVSVIVDGAEIHDPFHLRDFFRAFSTIDAEAVGAVSILTGGFPPEYGGRMSGVIDVTTLTPSATRTEVGVSALNTRVLSQGSFGKGRGEWLLSLRRGYLHDVLQLIGVTAFDPRYYDALGKLQWTFGRSTILSAHVLESRDRLRNDDVGQTALAADRDRHLWLSAKTNPIPRLFAQSVASIGTSKRDRHGAYGLPNWDETGSADDRRQSRVVAWKNDATFDFAANEVKGGITLRRARASYDYAGAATIRFGPSIEGGPRRSFTRAADVDVAGNEVAAYLADRVRIGDRVVLEGGARLDSESYTPDGAHLDPRIDLAWLLGERTFLRAAWGRFTQPQRIDELQVEDGIDTFFRAERAEHRVLGIERTFAGAWSGRVELYEKRFRDLHVRFENIFDRVVLFPELRGDRVAIRPERGTARGFELLVRSDFAKPLSCRISYAHAAASDRLGGRDVPRGWDQPDTLMFSVNYRRGAAWNFNVAGTARSGWPTTPVTAFVSSGNLVIEAGPLNSRRFPMYRRLDFRATRTIPLRRSALSAFVEVFNVFNQSNVVHLDYFDITDQPGGAVSVIPRYQSLAGVLPTFGVTWQFCR